MKELTLVMPYYHNDKLFNEITIQTTLGFVDVLDGNRNTIFSGYTVEAMKFINDLEKA